jgi:hypothetical protein
MSYQHLPEAEARERATKFTPERQQIKALVRVAKPANRLQQ